jgi:hypothetical protein
MRFLGIVLALAAAVTGFRAAWHWYNSSRVYIDPGWSGPAGPGPSEPVDPELQQSGWAVAILEAFEKASALNRKAALWTAWAVGLGALASIFGALS